MVFGPADRNSAIPYKFANVKTICHRLETTPFRPSWICTPGRLQKTFANESFMDELAAAVGDDPLEFRLKYFDPNDKRGIEILERMAKLRTPSAVAYWPSMIAPGSFPAGARVCTNT
jgi:CO/xanthine dehydrogenase Mo-binding subunit